MVFLLQIDVRFEVGGFDTTIHGWGGEDVDVFNKFIAYGENITVFRAVDPGLVHVFHPRFCDETLPKDQFKMCQGTKADSSIGLRQLAEIFYLDRNMFSSFARKVNKLDKPEPEIESEEESKKETVSEKKTNDGIEKNNEEKTDDKKE
uniref:Hexosyltransferase n=1 Tax=Clastoptera arizonana TaxID=38151 RepID=A0A1B6DND4_9HEMI